MSNVAVLLTKRAESLRDYLGPADVTRVFAHEIEVRLPTGVETRARIALATTYEAREDDVVLVIGNADGYYVIGVLNGSGRTVLEFHGDVDVRAVGGALHLSADKGVHIHAPEVEVNTGKLRLVADAVVQTFTSLRQRVAEIFSLQAGQTHTVVEGSAFSQSKSATIQTQEKVLINGKEIYLG
jgi:hypothetical protein